MNNFNKIKDESEMLCEELEQLNEWIQKADERTKVEYILAELRKINRGIEDLYFALEMME